MGFKLSNRSKLELQGVHHHLWIIVKGALEISKVDFMVYEGVRTPERQRAYVAQGVSRTMESRHIISRVNGKGHAVDLVPLVDGRLRWEWDPCFKVADAVREVAVREEIPVRWGGCWDMLLTDTELDAKEFAFGYAQRMLYKERKLFADGPHFELPRSHYP